MAKGRKSKKVVRQLICDCKTTKITASKYTRQFTQRAIGRNCQCYQDGVGKFKALNTYIHKI
jgi:hypothetical protein